MRPWFLFEPRPLAHLARHTAVFLLKRVPPASGPSYQSVPAPSAQSRLLIYFPRQHLAFWDSTSLLAWGPSHHELSARRTCRAWGVAPALPRPLLGDEGGGPGA